MPHRRSSRRIAFTLLLGVAAPVAAQQLVLDGTFAANGTAVMAGPTGWWTDWNQRDAHLVNVGGALPGSYVVGGVFRTLVGGIPNYQRSYASFTDTLATGSVFDTRWQVGPPLTLGGIVVSGTAITFVGTGNPGGAVESVHLARTDLDPFASPATSCAGGFQAHLLFGPNALEQVRGAAPRPSGGVYAVGETRLADGQSRGLVASILSNCAPDPGFGSGGAVVLDVNPFVIGAPPRRVRVHAVRNFSNGAGQPRILLAGGVRYGLDATSPGACFLAVMTPTGALDPTFDADGIRLFDAPAGVSPGPTYCDFHAVAPIADASGRGIVAIADWRRDTGVESGFSLLRFTEAGAPQSGFAGSASSSALDLGPSSLAIRSDGRIVFGRNFLTQTGGTLRSFQGISLHEPDTGLQEPPFVQRLPTDQASSQISAVVAAPGNRVYVIGTAGPGRFGHDRIVIARYTDGARTVTVNAIGGGTVGSSPPGIGNCGGPGGTCSATFPNGSVVRLNALPSPFNRFFGWGGSFAACGANPVCDVSVDANLAGNAQFVAISTVAIARTGAGSVTSDPAGITCGAVAGSPCSGSFDRDVGFGAVVRFTAVPAPGSRFVGWSGDFDICGANPLCDLVMDRASFNAAAAFAPLGDAVFADGFEP